MSKRRHRHPRRALALVTIAVLFASGLITSSPAATAAPAPVFQVEAGGSAIAGSPGWSADTAASPSPYVNGAAMGNTVYTTNASINMTDPSVPAGTPMAVFQSERYDAGGGADMVWNFPVNAGQYQVKLFFAEIYFTTTNKRVFNVTINGAQVLTNYDTVADVGALKGVVKTFTTTATAGAPNITISFAHVIENPSLKGIQIIPVASSSANQLGLSATSVTFPSTNTGSTAAPQSVQLTNLGAAGDPAITINSASLSGANATDFTAGFSVATPITLNPGASATLNVGYAPKVTGPESATITINHTGSNALTIPVSGTGAAPPPPPSGPLFQVEAGGSAIAGSPGWSADTAASPSPYVNGAAMGNTVYTTNAPINMTDPSVAAGTPMAVFQSERYDAGGGADMVWNFPVNAGQYQVKLLFAEIYFTTTNKRVFNATINGAQVLTNYDTFADVGALKGVVKTFTTTATAGNPNITISFAHVIENPSLKGIQIIPLTSGSANQLGATPTSVTFPSTNTGTTTSQAVQLTNLGGPSDPTITVNGASVAGANAGDFSASFSGAAPISLTPGASTTLTITYAPKVTGAESATITVAHSGSNAVNIPVSGTGATPPPPPPSGPLFQVEAGGSAITGSPGWSADTAVSPSPYVNGAAMGNTVYTTNASINMTDPSVPAGTPMAVFQSERYDAGGGADMVWTFPASAGQYQVKLFFAEIYFTATNQRVFNVTINGTQVLTNYDTVADVGALKGVVKTFTTTTTAGNPNITISFAHVIENPSLKGIQIIPVASSSANQLGASTTSVNFGPVQTGQPVTSTVTLTNLGGPSDPAITINGLNVSGTDANQFSANFPRVNAAGTVVTGPPVTLAPGATTTLTLWFAPAPGARSATLTVTSTASNASLPITLGGTGSSGGTAGFGKSTLTGVASGVNATVVKFGPDGRLYVADFTGVIHAYTLVRNSANTYSVTATETINLIKQIPNHDDNGALNASVTTRIVTGMIVVGTAANPRLYVTSSDPRIGGGDSGTLTNVDTNSSMLSRLDRTNGVWARLDLVRGLPRSQENHSANGMTLDPATNTLYVTQGGNTNMGAPSHNFNFLPEYAYSAAILSVNLTAIGNTTYDLPTLTDDQLPNLTGPFGGDFGRHQAKIVPGGPVQVYAPGFRNPYDIILTSAGRLYTTENGANAGWGDIPIGNGPGGTCTNGTSEPGVTDLDSLHLLSPGYYGGHPNPTRGNKANTFNTSNPQSPVTTADPQQCNYLKAGTPANPAVTTFDGSTNGITEYTATNFGGAMTGDLLAVNFGGSVFDIKLNPSTGAVVSNTTLFANVSALPLSLTTQGNAGAFPGVIFVADHATGNIVIFEPNDFGGASVSCTGLYGATDSDGDTFTNADEIRNHTNPCSAGSAPHDWNHNGVSDLLDPDDDAIGNGPLLDDTLDPFGVDQNNGKTMSIPFAYTWDNGAQPAQCASTPFPSGCPGGLLDLGFTGLMTDGHTPYTDLFDTSNMTVGGAAGALTLDKVPPGDALGASNTQQYAFQLGANTTGLGAFTVHTRLLSPFAGTVAQGNQSMGLSIGTGDQDNYFKIVATANGGSPGVRAVAEVGGVATTGTLTPVTLPSAAASAIDLYLTITPATGAVQPSFKLVDANGVAGPLVNVNTPRTIPTSWLTNANYGMAIGIISTSSGGPTFTASWKGLDAFLGAPPSASAPFWTTLAASPTARQEVSEVYSPTTKKFYVAGGLTTLHEAYNPATNTWAAVAPLPAALDHIQSVELNGLIYYVGGLSCWPSCSVGTVYIYNPTTNAFTTGAPMPAGRDRGAGGVAVFNGKIYYVGGLHAGADVAWVDVYNPATNSWASLADMPEVRDHFHAAVVGNRLYAIGGRRSDISGEATTTVNDYYDFGTATWVTGQAPLPTARAGFAAAVVGSKIWIIGGEGGNQTWNTVEAYDTATNSWSTGPVMPTARHGIEGAVCNGGVYVADGGLAEGGAAQTNVLEVYFPGGVATTCN